LEKTSHAGGVWHAEISTVRFGCAYKSAWWKYHCAPALTAHYEDPPLVVQGAWQKHDAACVGIVVYRYRL